MAHRSAVLAPKADKDFQLPNDEQTPEQIAQRVISKSNDNGDSTKPPSIFANISQVNQASSLFNNTGLNFNLPKEQGLFGTLNPSTQVPSVNLFSNTSSMFSNATSGLFSGLSNNNGAEKPNATSGLFSGLSNNNGAEKPNATSGLFSGLQNNNGAEKPAVGLFGVVFQPQKDQSDEDGDDGGDELQKGSDDEQQQIVMKFEYKKNTTQIVKYGLLKFRKNQLDVLEKGSISIEQVIDTDNYVVIYRNNIQNILHQGVIYKGISKVGALNQKQENLVIKLLSKNPDYEEKKEGTKQSQYLVDTIKLMFENAADADGFKAEFQKLSSEDQDETKKQ